MSCANTIIEYNKKIPCWLPTDPNSPFDLCTRCTYFKVEHVLHIWKETPLDISILEKEKFQQECIKQDHIYTLLLLISSLSSKHYSLFEKVYTIFIKYPSFQDKLNTESAKHLCSSNCSFYRHHLKQVTNVSSQFICYLPLNCWSCLAWIVRKENCLGLYNAFIRCLLPSKGLFFNTLTDSSLIDIMISLELKGKGHASRILFERYRRYINDEKRAKETLHLFLSQPAMIQSVFLEKKLDYYPSIWSQENYQQVLQKDVLKSVRKRNWVFKEELIMRTWAPHRLFRWCFDIENLKDFENPFEENFEQIE
jgi:hypothetical protein